MSQIRKGHETMCVVLTSRHKNLDTVRAVWSTGDIKARTRRCRRLGVGGAALLAASSTPNVGSRSFPPQGAPQSAAVSHLRLSGH